MGENANPRGSFTFIGNATALIRWGPFILLTDPNFLHQGQRAYLGLGLTTRRLREPALRLDELPALDVSASIAWYRSVVRSAWLETNPRISSLGAPTRIGTRAALG